MALIFHRETIIHRTPVTRRCNPEVRIKRQPLPISSIRQMTIVNPGVASQ